MFKMRKCNIIFLILFLNFSGVSMANSDIQLQENSFKEDSVALVDSCPPNRRAKINSYIIKVSCENNSYYNCQDIIPRKPTIDELCLIESLRLENELVIYKLDDLHVVHVFPLNQIKRD